MAAITGIATVMIDHLFVAVLADPPTEPILAITRKRRLITRAFCISGLRGADSVGGHYLFPGDLAAVHVQVSHLPRSEMLVNIPPADCIFSSVCTLNKSKLKFVL